MPHFGQIVRVAVERHGKTKRRPVVIVTPDEEIEPGGSLVGVCISTTIPEIGALPDHHIPLPWHRQGHPWTGLNERNAALCDWLIVFVEADIIQVVGNTPAKPLHKISEVLKKLADQDESGPQT